MYLSPPSPPKRRKFKKKITFIYFPEREGGREREREREDGHMHASGGRAERERERERKRRRGSKTGSRLSAQSPKSGSNSRTHEILT